MTDDQKLSHAQKRYLGHISSTIDAAASMSVLARIERIQFLEICAASYDWVEQFRKQVEEDDEPDEELRQQ